MGFMDWFNAKEAEFNTLYKAKYGVNAPVANAADQPGDKLAKAEAVTEALRRKGGPSWQEALLTGANSTMRIGDKAATGGATGLVGRVTGIDGGVTEEQMRKHNAAVHELSPGLHTAGMIGGALLSAPAAAITWGRGALGYGTKPVVGPMQAAVTKVPRTGIGPAIVGEAARPYTAGAFSRALTDAVARGSNAGAMSKAVAAANASTAAIVGGLGAYGLGVGEYKQAPAEVQPDDPNAWKSEAYMNANPAFAKSWQVYQQGLKDGGPQSSGEGNRPSAQAFRALYNPDGTLKAGVSPEQEQVTRAWAAFEGKGLAGQTPEGVRDTQMYDPTLFIDNPAAVAAGGSRTLVQVPTADGASAVAAVPTQEYVPGALADTMDAYEEQYPGNVGGPKSASSYRLQTALAKKERKAAEEAMHLALGLQVGITDPKLAIAASKSGAITNDMLARSAELQLSRTTPRTTFKDALVAQEMADIEVAARAAEAEKDPVRQKELKAAVSQARQRLLRWSLLGKEGLEDLMDTAKPNQ